LRWSQFAHTVATMLRLSHPAGISAPNSPQCARMKISPAAAQPTGLSRHPVCWAPSRMARRRPYQCDIARHSATHTERDTFKDKVRPCTTTIQHITGG
jgi:hypothetical protein